MIDIHLTGTFLVLKHAGRQMIDQGSGSIIVSSTVDALVGCAGLDSVHGGQGRRDVDDPDPLRLGWERRGASTPSRRASYRRSRRWSG
jgi:NAD(P)-dependent dehydrogenase (short-subunit alcohol dehydrogenase family)